MEAISFGGSVFFQWNPFLLVETIPSSESSYNSNQWKPLISVEVSSFGRSHTTYPANSYLFKVNNRNIRKRYEIYPKLTIKRPKQPHWYHSDACTVNFEYISHLFLVFLLLTLNKIMLAGLAVSIQMTTLGLSNIFPRFFDSYNWFFIWFI